MHGAAQEVPLRLLSRSLSRPRCLATELHRPTVRALDLPGQPVRLLLEGNADRLGLGSLGGLGLGSDAPQEAGYAPARRWGAGAAGLPLLSLHARGGGRGGGRGGRGGRGDRPGGGRDGRRERVRRLGRRRGRRGRRRRGRRRLRVGHCVCVRFQSC
jgi:hypothetical protein